MAFRNPIRHLDASGITGQITSTQITDGAITTPKLAVGAITADRIDVNALNGKTITGSTVQTATSGPRIVLSPDGTLYFPTGALEFAPAHMASDPGQLTLNVMGPRFGLNMTDYGLKLRQVGAQSRATLDVNTAEITGDLIADGVFSAGNMAWGSTSITPVANTDTNTTVTGVGLTTGLGIYRVWLLANTGSPGQINAVTATGASADGFTLWINRTATTPTNVWWLMLGK